MIDFIQVSKQFGTQDVLKNVTFRINAGERIGIVGPNGAGKSTIFSLINHEIEADAGDIVLPKHCRIGHLKQQLNPHEVELSLIDYTEDSIPELKTIPEKIQTLEEQLQHFQGLEKERALKQVGELQHTYEHLGGYEMRARAEAALSGLGFHVDEFEKPFTSFSGGWQMRAELARTLIANPDLLMLDEPSNFLDLPAVEWLQKFLRGYEGTMLLISHDRYLLRSLATVTLEIAGGQATRYQGGYDYYLTEREDRIRHQLAAKENQDREIEQMESFIKRFRAKSSKAAQVQSRIKQLEKMERIEAPATVANTSKIRLADPPHSGHEIIRLEKGGFSYDGRRWIFQSLDLNINRGEKIALVGYNGMGKTTLLRTLADALDLSEGKRVLGHKVVVGYQSQDFAETMNPEKSVYHIVKDEHPVAMESEVRNLLGGFGFSGDTIDKKVSVLSGGEKIRLAFARLFIDPPNFLLLDEPTTHLDVQGREALEQALKNYKGALCVVSHDVTFVRNIAEQIIAIDDSGVSRFPGNYDYYQEKVEQRAANVSPPAAGGTVSSPAGTSSKPAVKGKDARKARAAQREAEKALSKIERKIEKLTAEQTALTDEMMARRDADFASINARLAEIQGEIQSLEAEWEATAEALG
ncbi:ribosomal protection-like ABC-F family protein [Pontiella agarivorans]|uniref:ABC-F family ATP-binding cassette domain-containing protein n=1 Tax=Pontiella agarivorans TaxID=3038953 RepID=A0ABU5MXC2_9BACT|nr:ABC-F family ATP-binding cassette domain-containing protein [Pontiella agarivorans]MDZ8118802.1 ABC-F family ATP-binding cassette domain-containing protein [Pontiella agarivorans]